LPRRKKIVEPVPDPEAPPEDTPEVQEPIVPSPITDSPTASQQAQPTEDADDAAVMAEFNAEHQATLAAKTHVQRPSENPEETLKKKQASREPSEGEYRRMEKDIKEVLDSQPTVRIRLSQTPEGSSDKPLPDETVAINGFVYWLPRGVRLDVPESVANVLEETGRL
jgi:hypothetical protein